MKKQIIKPIAFFTLLLGAANAYAAGELETVINQAVQGNKPVLAKKGADPLTISDNDLNKITVTYGTTAVPQKLTESGDQIVFEFSVADIDGDEDSDGLTARSLIVYYGRTQNDTIIWSKANASSYQYASPNKVVFTLGNDAIGTTKIGYRIQAHTTFGIPRIADNWLSGDSLLASVRPALDSGSNLNQPQTGGTGDGDDIIIDGAIAGAAGSKVAIFIIDSTGNRSQNLSAETINPQLGDELELVFWSDTVNVNDRVDSGETVMKLKNVQWTVLGGNSNAGGSAAQNDEYIVATAANNMAGTKFKLPLLNSDIISLKTTNNVRTDTETGIQGFRIKASAEVE